MKVYLDTANLIDLIDGALDAGMFRSIPGVTWCVSWTTVDDLVGQQLHQKLAILNIVGREDDPMLIFRPGHELLQLELGRFAKKQLGVPQGDPVPIASWGSWAPALSLASHGLSETTEENAAEVLTTDQLAGALEEIDAERKWQKRQIAFAVKASKLAKRHVGDEVQEALNVACETPTSVPPLALEYFEWFRGEMVGVDIPEDGQIAAAIADGSIANVGMEPERWIQTIRMMRAMRDGEASRYFSILKELADNPPTSGRVRDVADNIPKDERVAWAFRLMLANTPDEVRQRLFDDVPVARKLAAAWLRAPFEETPGAALYRDASYQFMRNTGHRPIPSTENDFYHLLVLPHVDVLFADAQTVEYVNRAKEVPAEVRERLRPNAGFRAFVEGLARTGSSQ